MKEGHCTFRHLYDEIYSKYFTGFNKIKMILILILYKFYLWITLGKPPYDHLPDILNETVRI